MDHEQRLALARQVYDKKLEDTHFAITWAGGGEPQHYSGKQGLQTLAVMLRITRTTLENYFSRGRGRHEFKGINPTTGEMDIGTIHKINPPAKEKRGPGRPRKYVDWERLGPEAPGYPGNPQSAQSLHTSKNHAKKDKSPYRR